MKSRKTVSVAALSGMVLTCLLIWHCMGPRDTLEFVRHARLGATHVAIFRMKLNSRCKVELGGPGEILAEGACFQARWFTNFAPTLPACGEQEFAVIAPYEKTPWQLRLTIQRPCKQLNAFSVKLQACWQLLKNKKTQAPPIIQAVWSPNGANAAADSEALMARALVAKPSPIKTLTATVTNELPVP